MAKTNVNSTILTEHRRIVSARHILAVINFIAVFLSTFVTLFFVNKRGASNGIVICLYLLLGINVAQLALCIIDYAVKRLFGAYIKALPIISYIVGAAWVIVWVIEMVIGSSQIGSMRQDLLIVSIIQLVVALAAYLVWPMLDRQAINAMIRPSVRDDEHKRKSKSKKFVGLYVLMCLMIILAQAGVLFTYRLPPRLYDIFEDSRAIAFELTEDGESYIVKSVYRGTSSSVNIPATYNNKPVVGIASGALVEDEVIEKYQITEITFGTPTTTEDGQEITECNLLYIENGAIDNDKITKLTLPSSLTRIEAGAIQSDSLTNLEYAAKADFDIAYLQCSALQNIVMAGENVGRISSLEGMNKDVTIQVNKDIYNQYRKDNFNYVKSFNPILADDEFVLDFYSNCDYYVESVFSKIGTPIQLSIDTLVNNNMQGISPKVDTEAYIKDSHELGTEGAKANSAFRGWYFDETFADECVFTQTGSVEITKNTTIYAKWIDEYTGTLNWGTYKPLNAETKQYWTDEDTIEFPVVTGREGYVAGVQWFVGKSTTPVADSDGISEDVQLNGIWTLDKPEIDVDPQFNKSTGLESDYNQNNLTFTYDETNRLSLYAEYAHPLNEFQYNGKTTRYEFKWTKQEDSAYFSENNVINVVNVPEAGKYTLEVTVISPYGETSSETTNVEVTVNKKAISIGTAAMVDAQVTYDGSSHQLLYTGDFGSDNLKATYHYYKDGNLCTLVDGGVVNAGEYRVEALFEKDNAAEAVNYETKTLHANLNVAQRPLSLIGWTGKGDSHVWADNTTVYNGKEHEVEMQVGNIVSGDSVVLTYNSGNKATNAGTYTAVVESISNSNYTLSEILGVSNRYEWTIAKKPVSVLRWELSGSGWNGTAVTYDGNAHSVTAVLDGAENGETIAFLYATAEPFTNSETNAGEYQAQIIGVDSANYLFDLNTAQNVTFSWSITKRELSVTYNTPTLTYNGTAIGINATIGNFVSSDLSSFDKDSFLYEGMTSSLTVGTTVPVAATRTLTIPFTAINSDSYTAAISGINSEDETLFNNYTVATTNATSTFTISPKPLTVITDQTNHVYTAAAQKLTLTVKGILQRDIDHIQKSNFLGTEAVEMEKSGTDVVLVYYGTAAGTYPVAVSGINEENGNYVIQTAHSDNVTISPRALTVNKWMIKDLSKAQNEQVSQFNATTAIYYNYNGYSVYPTLNGVQGEDEVVLTIANGEKSAAATYTTTASLPVEYTNYTFESVSQQWTVLAKTVNVSWTVDQSTETSFVYTGINRVAKPSYTLLGDDTISLQYASNSDGLTQKNADSYEIVLEGTGNSNYVLGSGKNFTFTITPAPVTVEWTETAEFVYNGQYQSPTFALNGLMPADIQEGSRKIRMNANGVAKSFDITSENEYSFTNTNGFAVNVGDYTLSDYALLKGGLADTNYTITGSKTFKITPKTLTLSGVWTYYNKNTSLGGTYGETTKLIYNYKGYSLTTTISEGMVQHLGNNVTLALQYSGNEWTNKDKYTASVIGFTQSTSVSGFSLSNYVLPTENTSCAWEIHAKSVRLSWTQDEEYTYTKTEKTSVPSYLTNASADDDGGVYSGDSLNIQLTFTGHKATVVGDYTANATAINNPNYVLDETTTTHEWKINKREIDALTWNWTIATYNGADRKPTATVYVNGETLSVDGYDFLLATDSKNVGTYTIKANSLTDDKNYALKDGEISCTFEIQPLAIEIEWYVEGTDLSPTSGLTYNGEERTALARVINLKGNDEVELAYATNTFKNVGAYTAQVVGFADGGNPYGNYKLGTNMKASFGVMQKTVTFVWEGATQVTYDGQEHSLIAKVNPADICGVDTVNVVSYVSNLNSRKNAGSSTIQVGTIDNNNYKFVANSTTAKNTLTIDKKVVTFNWSLWNNQSVVYDKEERTILPIITDTCGKDVGVETYLTTKDGVSYGNVNTILYAGVYVVKVTKLNDDNFAIPANNSATYTIQKRAVELEWRDQEYTYYYNQKYIVSPVLKNVVGDDMVSVNSYSMSKNGGSASNNSVAFTITDAGTYKITAKGLNNSNYEIASNATTSVTYKINTQELELVWSGVSQSVVYDNTKRTLTWEFRGSEDNHSVNSGYVSGTSVNTYTATASFNNSNYHMKSGETTEKSFTITPIYVTLDWSAFPQETTYRQNVSYTVAPTLNGVISTDGVAIRKYTVTKDGNSYSSNTIKNVGRYVVKVNELNNGNYAFANGTTLEYTINIKQQAVGIIWSGATEVTYDGAKHSLSATVYGTEDNAVVKTKTYTTSSSNVGDYRFEMTETLDSNYTYDGYTGEKTQTVTITPQRVNITWSGNTEVIYDGRIQSLTATVKGATDGKLIKEKTYYTDHYNVDTYNFEMKESLGNNYTYDGYAGDKTASITIKQQEVVVVWRNNGDISGTVSYVYDGRTRSVGAVIYGKNDGTQVKTLSFTVNADVGTYTFNVTSGDITNNNYTLVGATNTSLTVNITPATPTLTWSVRDRAYEKGWETQVGASLGVYGSPLDDIEEVFNFEKKQADGSWVVVNTYDVGTYRLVATGLTGADTSNYTLAGNTNLVSAEFTISTATVTISWPQSSLIGQESNVVLRSSTGERLTMGVDYKVERTTENISDATGTSVVPKFVVTLLNSNYVISGDNYKLYN